MIVMCSNLYWWDIYSLQALYGIITALIEDNSKILEGLCPISYGKNGCFEISINVRVKERLLSICLCILDE